MSESQVNTLKRAFAWGKQHGLGETMRAICWQESSCGLDLENEPDGSYGWFGNRALIVASRIYERWPDRPTEYEITTCRDKLLESFEFSAQMCFREITYWQTKYNRGEWTKVWASYNAGNEWENGRWYAQDIKDKIMFLRKVL